MRLVDEHVIDAKLVKHQPVILLILRQQILQPFGPRRLLLLDGLDEIDDFRAIAALLALDQLNSVATNLDEAPDAGDLVGVNMSLHQLVGLFLEGPEIPPTLLARADEVIE